MAYKELVIYFLLLNAILMTHSQIVNYQHDRCNNDKYLRLKVSELQLELSVYHKEATESERQLQGQITQLKEELAECKEKYELWGNGNEFISILLMTGYNRLFWFQKMGIQGLLVYRSKVCIGYYSPARVCWIKRKKDQIIIEYDN